jgi:hypothetical protein
MLPLFAAIITFIADQANMAHLQSRVIRAHDAALLAAALDFGTGSRAHAQLEAYAKDFFLANLGDEYRDASSVRPTTPRSSSSGVFMLEAHVKYEPLSAPFNAAAPGMTSSEFVVDVH